MRKLSIFGATGSVGCNTIDLIRRQGGCQAYDIVALSGGRNLTLLASQAVELKADIAVTAYPECLAELRELLSGSGVEAAAGPQAITDAAARKVDWVMSAIVGSAGLMPGLVALQQGATLALANKESLVTAGPLMLATAKAHGARILPVDSEHSAIFQALNGEDATAVERIILTASGGPFRTWDLAQLAKATPLQARTHPKWDMGQRISIDSASLFNKAMEVIETKEFFGVNPEVIEVIIHPQSIIHSLVGFKDGALMAHMGPADMRGPIGYALNWPNRAALPLERLDLAALGRLDFEAPDPDRFPALRLARAVMATGGLAGAAFNAAKEVALDGFIAGQIGFLDMARIVELVLNGFSATGDLEMATITLESIVQMDQLARVKTQEAMRLPRAV